MSQQHSIDEQIQAASSAYLNNNQAEAQAILSKLVREQPQAVQAWVALGQVLEQPEQKRHCFEQALTLEPQNAQAYNGLQQLTAQQKAAPAAVAPATGPTLKLRQPQSPSPNQQPTPASPTLAAGQTTIDLKRGLVQGNLTLPQWRTQLTTIGTDLQATQKRRTSGCLLTVIGLAVVAVGLFLEINILIIAVGIVISIASLIYRSQQRVFIKKDMLERLDQVVVPLLNMLSEDLQPNQPIDLQLDLLGPVHNHKQQSERTFELGSAQRITEKNFTDDWFSGSASMIDGTQLRWTITDNVRHRLVRKRNSRGKTKIKTKIKTKQLLKTQLLLKKTYQPAQQAQSQTGSQVSYDAAKQKLIASRSIEQPQYQETVMELLATIGDMYRFVQP